MDNNENLNEISENTEVSESEQLLSFEFNVKNEEENSAFLMFQKKYVYKKNIIKTIGFGILAAGFAISAYRDPSMTVNYMLLGVCLAAIAAIWYNTVHIRKSLMEALKMLEDDRYIFTLYDGSFRIETIQTDEEKTEEDYVPIPPQTVEFPYPGLDVIECADKFIIILRKETIYVLPKRCMTDKQAEIIRGVFETE